MGKQSIIRRETYCTFGADDAEILRFVERPLVRRIILATWSYIFWCKFEEFKERKKQQTKVAPLVVPRFFPERKGEREKKKILRARSSMLHFFDTVSDGSRDRSAECRIFSPDDA